MPEPSKLLVKLARQLFIDPTVQAEFISSLTQPQPYPPSIIWCQARPLDLPFSLENPLPWQPSFVDRLALDSKPGQHYLHQAGAFYCVDFSSIFAASVLLAIPQPVELIIDVCAAPGGKSVFAWRQFQPQLLIANEAIGKRLPALVSNLKRCCIFPNLVTNLDPSVLAQKYPQTSDLVIVDAPCSGQSLLAKGEANPGCFHPLAIDKNANRQKRIIINAASLVAPQGYLVYLTCTYSPGENERVCTWFLQKMPQFKPVAVSFLQEYQSQLTDIFCYRMFPQQKLGAGGFTALFQNTATGERNQVSSDVAAKIYRGVEKTNITFANCSQIK